MKTTGDVLESNYCNVLSQKHRQVLKPLAGVTLLALIISFDVISHHKELNPSHMINWAIAKIGCMAKNVLSWCHQIKHPHHLRGERLWGSAWPSPRVWLREGCPSLRVPCPVLDRWPSKAQPSVSSEGPDTATQSCFQTAGDTFHLWEIKSCLMEGNW